MSSKTPQVIINSIINTNILHSFNAIERVPNCESTYIVVSDEGILSIIDKKSESDKNKDLIEDLKVLDDQQDDLSDNTNDTQKFGGFNSGNNNNFGKFNANANSMTGKKKDISNLNKFSPY